MPRVHDQQTLPVSAENEINEPVNILIVGASGNLGSHLTRYLLLGPHRLRLLTHKRPLRLELPWDVNAEIVRADLGDPSSLLEVCKDIDCTVYLAGVLFRRARKSFCAKLIPSTCKY